VADLPQSPPARAPALYFVGTLPDADGGRSFNFRLPCPPTWHDRAPSAWAADRRARRAYFATLDALRSGRVDEEEVAKSQRLLADIRSMSARAALTHFLRIMDTVREGDGVPVIPTPPAPLSELVVTAPAMGGTPDPTELARRYRWALEWLEARRYVVGRGLQLQWLVRRMTLHGVVVVPAEGRPTAAPAPAGAKAR
jgi:hypothetical protein